jgi:GTP-binding protein
MAGRSQLQLDRDRLAGEERVFGYAEPPMLTRNDLRNVAIIAHVDHGKTTLVDAMLRQTGAFRANMEIADRILDSGDLEREKGITILAKHTAIQYGKTKITIVDTPGHADFGGEVERALAMVDGVLLLVDASEGPLPQTRFVLRKTLEAGLAVVVVINKVDRSDARTAEVVREVEDLFLDLDAAEDQLDFPVLYASARQGWASTKADQKGTDLTPLFEAILKYVPAPTYDPEHPLQALVTNLDASSYVGRLALCRVHHGTLRRGEMVAWCRVGGSIVTARITELYASKALERIDVEAAGPGEIVAVAGFAEISIGDTLADPEDPRPLAAILVDEPSLSMTVGINTSPLAGNDGTKLTARLVKGRLDSELVGNVSLRVLPTPRPDTWEVQGRGELQLAVLIETMRREGFELTVGKPQVVTREIDGMLHEPMERVAIDVPEEYLGVVTQLLALRQGRLEEIVNHGTGWIRMDYRVPARGLVGFRTEFLVETRGTGVLHSVFDGWEPWHGGLRTRRNGSMVSDRRGVSTTEALMSLGERGSLLIGPGTEVYEGMVIGENARADEMDVNPTREKKQSNMRSSTSDVLISLSPHLQFSLEQSLDFIGEDECAEVTPKSVRLRKLILEQALRARQRRRGNRDPGT